MLGLLEEVGGPNDLTKDRTYVYDNGLRMTIKSNGMYGFWSIHASSGSVAKEIAGNYTDFNRAKSALDKYMESYNAKNVHEKHIVQKVETNSDRQEKLFEPEKPTPPKTKSVKKKQSE